MASRGKTETEILEKNLYSQLDRLIDQLKDIDESRFVLFTNHFFFPNLILEMR